MATHDIDDLVAQLRNLGEWRTPRFGEAKLVLYLNGSIRKLRSMVMRADPNRFDSSDTISVVSGTESYSLPSDCDSVVAVLAPDSTSQSDFRLVERIDWQDRHTFPVTATGETCAYYAIRGTKIYIFPVPTYSSTWQVDYIAKFVDLATGDGVVPDLPDGWHEWVLADAAVKCALEVEQDWKGFGALRNDIEKVILHRPYRDKARPRRLLFRPSSPYPGGRRYGRW